MRDAGYEIPDMRYRICDAGCGILDARCSVLHCDVGFVTKRKIIKNKKHRGEI